MRLSASLVSALIPPLAAVPLFAVFMAVTHHIDMGGWLPFGSITRFARALCFAYLIATVFHAIYGTIVFFASRKIGVRHIALWVAVYVLPLGVLAVISADTYSDLIGGATYVAFALAIALLAWPFVRQELVAR